jgi:hypothetical protein
VPVNGALLFFPLVLTGVSTKSQSEISMKGQKNSFLKLLKHSKKHLGYFDNYQKYGKNLMCPAGATINYYGCYGY